MQRIVMAHIEYRLFLRKRLRKRLLLAAGSGTCLCSAPF